MILITKNVNEYISDSRGNSVSNQSGVVGSASQSRQNASAMAMRTGQRVLPGIVGQGVHQSIDIGHIGSHTSSIASKMRDRATEFRSGKMKF